MNETVADPSTSVARIIKSEDCRNGMHLPAQALMDLSSPTAKCAASPVASLEVGSSKRPALSCEGNFSFSLNIVFLSRPYLFVFLHPVDSDSSSNRSRKSFITRPDTPKPPARTSSIFSDEDSLFGESDDDATYTVPTPSRPPKFQFPISYGEHMEPIRLIGFNEVYDNNRYPGYNQKDMPKQDLYYYDPAIAQYIPFFEPIASFMQKDGNIIAAIRVLKNDPPSRFLAVPVELLNDNAQLWIARWLHLENPDDGGEVYKVINGKHQYWKIKYVMEVIKSKVKVQYYGGFVDVVPIKHLHEDLRPSVGTLAAAYKAGDRTPI